ncbi:MAG: hypothetical protein ACOYOK_03675 [Pseudobdellovibrionaceae bacterium]
MPINSDLDLAVVLPDSIDKRNFKKNFYKNRTRIKIPVDFIFRNEKDFLPGAEESLIDQVILESAIEIYPRWRIHD